MEAATTKRTRSGGGFAAPDRLSALPDELLRHVLSFLPSPEVVRTTVLSKRWVDLWRSVLAINLDINDFPDAENPGGSWEKMKKFATNLLMLHNAKCLDVFKLAIDYHRYGINKDADQWIRCAIMYHPLMLDINATSPRNESLYKLDFHRLGSRLCRLKKLVLASLHLNHHFAKLIQSGCPVLEGLVLLNCRNEFPDIQSDTLKNLVVCSCASEVADVLCVKAPALSSLLLDFPVYRYKNGASLEAGHSLVRAAVSLILGAVPGRGATKMLVSLFNVTSLELSGFSTRAVLDKELDEFPIFGTLRILSLNFSFHSSCDLNRFNALGTFLQKTPILEKLTLRDFWKYPEGYERSQQMVIGCSFPCWPEEGQLQQQKYHHFSQNRIPSYALHVPPRFELFSF